MMRGLPVLVILIGASACTDVSRYSSSGDHYEGTPIAGDFVRAGIDGATRMCLTLDAAHLESEPGVLSSSDGRFRGTRLRPIPQLEHDALSTFAFGEGRAKNLLYVAAAADGDDFVVVSLMKDGGVQLRLLRGAPGGPSDAGASAPNVFAVFELSRTPGPCAL